MKKLILFLILGIVFVSGCTQNSFDKGMQVIINEMDKRAGKL